MKYIFLRDGKEEQVGLEKWVWEATYMDGTLLRQFGEDGVFHQFKEIDQNRLHVFSMRNVDTDKKLTLLFDEEMKLIHFYRNARLNIGTEQEVSIRLYCFGYEINVGGKTYKNLMVILPSGEVVLTNDINKIDLV